MALPEPPKNGADDDATGEDITKNREELQENLSASQEKTTDAVNEAASVQTEQLNIAKDAADAERARAGAELEASREAARAAGGPGGGDDNGAKLSAKEGKKGGLFAGIAGALGGMGIGAGVAMGGMGALFAGGGYLLKQISEFDGKAVVANVKELLKITELFGGVMDAAGKMATMALVMTGLGVGLAAFGIGAAVGGVGAAIAKFAGGENWASKIVGNVKVLLGIQDLAGYSTFKFTEFTAVMGGIGLGVAAFGIGSAVGAVGVAIAKFVGDDKWSQKIVDHVKILLSISTIMGTAGETLKKGGVFFLTMTGLGAGLGVFGIGAALAGVSQFITKDDWARTIVTSVTTLMEIGTLSIWSAAKFPALMTAIAGGLIAFSIGSAVAGLAAGLTRFTGGTKWARDIVDSVKILMEIGKLSIWSAVKFAPLMTAIAAGLIAFSAGSAVAGLAAGLTQFSGGSQWARDIVTSVTTLMEISAIKFGDAAGFTAVMTAIAAGLIAFAVGKGANSMTDVIGKFTGNFADNIVKDVKTLLGMLNDKNIDQKKANTFSSIMGTISGGLMKFAGGKLISGLAGAATGILNFLSGEEGPVKQMMGVAKAAPELERAAKAMDSVSVALEKFSGIKLSSTKMDFTALAENLGKSIPLLRLLATGGTLKKGWFSSDLNFGPEGSGGILDPKLKLDEVAYKVALVRNVLQGGAMPKRADYSNQLKKATDARDNGVLGAAGGTNVTTLDASTNSQQTTNATSQQTSITPRAEAGNSRGRPRGRRRGSMRNAFAR